MAQSTLYEILKDGIEKLDSMIDEVEQDIKNSSEDFNIIEDKIEDCTSLFDMINYDGFLNYSQQNYYRCKVNELVHQI